MPNQFFSSLFTSGFVGFILFVLVSVILFIIFRDLTLWYFRINENTDSLRRIAESLEEISATLAADEIVTEEVITEDNSSK